MGWNQAYPKTQKYCAFCKNWYDPTNSAIRPKVGEVWEYDNYVQKRCLVLKIQKFASTGGCKEYRCKI